MLLQHKPKIYIRNFYLFLLVLLTSIFSFTKVNASGYEHHIGPFYSQYNSLKQSMENKCDKLVSRTIPKLLSVAKKNQRQLECTGYEYFGEKRLVELIFSDGKLDIIHIKGMRDMLPDLKYMLEIDFGDPSLSTSTVDYFDTAGISLRVFPDHISFVSERAKTDYSRYMQEIKDIPINMSLTKDEWLQDLTMVDFYIRNKHVNPFWYNNESEYMELYYQAHDYINSTDSVDSLIINAFIDKMVAYISDGHSYVLNRDKRFGFYAYKVEWFSDGLFITQTDEENQHLLGGKILSFDDTKTEIAAEKIEPFLTSVNTSSIKLFSKYTYQFAGILFSAGITKKSDSMVLTLKLPNGEIITQNFIKDERDYNEIDFVSLSEVNNQKKPMYRQHTNLSRWDARWFEYMEKEDALYVYYGSVVELDEGSIAKFSKEIMQIVESKKPGKLIIDVRNNGGGDSMLNAPLINAIAKNKHINQHGKLFVITGRNTFSAAINFSGNMEIKTKALFAGEKTGDSASFAGEAGNQAKYKLPNSNIILSLSFSEWETTYDGDKRDSITLDIPVELSSRDFLSSHDPVLEAVLNYKKIPPKDVVLTSLEQSKWLGRYDYSADKALKITKNHGVLQFEITELAFSNLYPVNKTEMRTDMSGIRLRKLPNGNIELIQLGSSNRELRLLKDNDLKPLELLISGRFIEAKESYLKIYSEQPKLLSIRGNSMAILANHIRERHNSQLLYDQVREITVAMHGFPIYSWLDF